MRSRPAADACRDRLRTPRMMRGDLRRAEGREGAAYFPGFLSTGCFGGSDRACSMPMSTHRERSSSLARSSGPTRSHPGISRPCITAAVALLGKRAEDDVGVRGLRDRARSARLGRWFRGLVALEQGLDGEHEGRHQRGAFLRPDHPTAAMTGEVCERHHAPPSYD